MSMKPRATFLPAARTSLVAVLSLALLPAPAVFAQASASTAVRSRADAVTLNFVNADIEGVARAMSAILKQQFVVDPRVKGTMTLYSEEALSPREAYLNFLAALRGLGFTVVEVGGLFKIVPEADAKLQTGTVSIGDVSRRGDQIITQIFKLNHENANNLVPVLRPLISPNNTINANPGNNTLVITDYADNLSRIAKIVSAMDVPPASDVEVIPLKYAVAADLVQLVQRLSDASGGPTGVPGVPGAATSSATSILVDQRSNALIIRAPTPARMAVIKSLIDKLDTPTPGGTAMGNIWVVYLKNADAVKLATVLRAAFPSGGNSGGGGGGSSNTGNTSPLSNSAQNANSTGTSGASTQSTAPLGSSAGPSTGGFIQADPASNALIITAPEVLYRQLRAVIDQLDSRRAQVYIESLIVEVNPSVAADLGVQWQALSNTGSTYIGGLGTNFSNSGTNILSNASATTALGALAGLSGGGNIGLIRKIGSNFGLAAIANALQQQSGTNILSTPNLVTLDNEEARIVVGQNVPFVTGQYTNTGTSTSSPFQTIERKDVGTTLKIKPQIGENGTVRMVIYQESSSIGAVATGTANAGPTTNKRSIESTVVVDDGQIIVLGGLIEDLYTTSREKVPLLGDIPYIGGLFRSEHRERKRTNLMVFLRPIVMRDQIGSNKVSLDRYDYIRAQQLENQPVQNSLLGVNELPVLPQIRPGDTDANGAPRPLGDTAPPSPPLAPSVPAPASAPQPAPAPTTN
ncbi:type II secretion system secretin GspD [soil metagenome]